MVSFSTPYLHLGRWLAERRARLAAVPVLALALLALGVALGPKAPAAVLLVGVLLYGAQPAARSFRRVMG